MSAVSPILDHWHFRLKNMMHLVDCLYHDLRHRHPGSDHRPGWLHTLSKPKWRWTRWLFCIYQGHVLLGSIISGWLGFLCSAGENTFLVGLVDQPYRLVSNKVKTVEKAFAWLCHITIALVKTTGQHIAAENSQGRVIYWETYRESTQTSCGWNGWSK